MKLVIHNVREIGSNRMPLPYLTGIKIGYLTGFYRALLYQRFCFSNWDSNMLMVAHVSVCQFSTNQLYQEEKKLNL